MKPLTDEWIAKAEGDLEQLGRTLTSIENALVGIKSDRGASAADAMDLSAKIFWKIFMKLGSSVFQSIFHSKNSREYFIFYFYYFTSIDLN